MIPRIEATVPREQVGPQTGAAYDFQYAEAALACLELLKEGDASCVYCEWHDDYVVVSDAYGPHYEFFQVKSRSQSSEAWTMTSILGVKGSRPRKSAIKQVSKKERSKNNQLESTKEIGIAERLLDHQRHFRGACAAFAVVTNKGVKEDRFFDLLENARKLAADGKGPDALAAHSREIFDELVTAYQQRDSQIIEDDVWNLVSRLRIQEAQGRFGDLSVAIGLMGQRIYDFAEVDLKATEQRHIANRLLAAVRAKSHRVLAEGNLPPAGDVRRAKAVTLDEVLLLLPLSPSGYRALKAGGRKDVKELSRLHRLCKQSGMDQRMIEQLCTIRIRWDEWRAEHLDALSDSVFTLIKEHALKMLNSMRRGKKNRAFARLQSEAESFVNGLKNRKDIPELAAEHVVGLVFALAASEE